MATKENRLLKNTNIKIKEGKEKYCCGQAFL